MIRRFSAVLILCLLLFSFSHNLVAQVYPDREELDVVRLVDGTVLKGVILEKVPEQYLEIQLYGGSTFVLAYEQIEAVEREANPDYGTTWIKVDLGDWDADITATPATATPGDSGPRPLSAGGHMVSVYSYGIFVTAIGLGSVTRTGNWAPSNWEEAFTETGISEVSSPDNGEHKSFSVGVNYLWWRPVYQSAPTTWVYGIRGTAGVLPFVLEDKVNVQNVEPGYEYMAYFRAQFIPVLAEGLIGFAGERTALVAGLGAGIGIVEHSAFDFEVYYDDGTDTDLSGELTVKHPVTPLYSASLTGLFRLGRRWVVEAGLWANGQFVSAFEEGFVFRGWGERIAIGYRFGGR